MLILASQSPRRAALLRQVGLSFTVIPSHIDESHAPMDDAGAHVRFLSEAKAGEVAKDQTNGLVIGADTVVVLDGRILNKPADENEASAMLESLSGQSHAVYTGLTLIGEQGKRLTDAEKTLVRFRRLSRWEIEDYIASGGPMDKAGAYGIQERAGLFVSGIEGDYHNVVGFPLALFFTLWRQIAGDAAVRNAWAQGNRHS